METEVESNRLARRRVLVVEDEYYLADDMAAMLARWGAEVIGPVPTPGQAFALLAELARLDAAVLDVMLRGETVFPLADALRDRAIPFVFSTGFEPDSLPASYAGVPSWLKPFDPADLARALPALLAD